MSMLVKFEQRTKSGTSYIWGESITEVLRMAFPDMEKRDIVLKYMFWGNCRGFENSELIDLPQLVICEQKQGRNDYVEFHGLIYCDESI